MSFARTAVNAACVTGFSLVLLAATLAPADASGSPQSSPDVPSVATTFATDLAPVPVTITLTFEGRDSTYTTEAKTFGDFLTEIGFHPGPDDYLMPDAAAPLVDGMRAEYRVAVALTVVYGKRKYSLHTSALTLDEALANARIGTGPRDVFSADRRSLPLENEVLRVTRVNEWTERSHRTIAQHVLRRFDSHLALGQTRVVSRGVPEIREVTIRYSRRGNAPARKTILQSRVVRAAKPEIVARGTFRAAIAAVTVPSTISKFASTGLTSAFHLAKSVFHVMATAYIAACYKCSGTTANGMHAGFGVIAVDPRLIPLGTRLMIPGYGRAIAGDTGGAIIGHRVDLGMNTLADALRFGRRPMTVYVLK